MRLFLYYAFHSVKNQLKKLFRTWVMIFILVCMAVGIIFGSVASLLEDAVEEGPEEGPAVTQPDETPDEDIAPVIRDGDGNIIYAFNTPDTVDLISTGVILFILMLTLGTYDSTSIFLPGDTTLLFPSPLSPQKVLYFRLSCSLGAVLVGGIYFLFQIPNLILNVGLGLPTVLCMALALGCTIAISTVLKVIVYLYASGNSSRKRTVKVVFTACLLGAVAGIFIYSRVTGTDNLLVAAIRYAVSVNTRFVPLLGWTKGIIMYSMEDNYAGVALCFLGVVAGIAAAVFFISRMKADYYEDAMAKSEEVAALSEAMKNKGSIFGVARKNKKDRSETLRRDGLNKGRGASVFFFKQMYNRFRFAFMGVFTKTCVTYCLLGIGLALILRFLTEVRNTAPVMLLLGALVFYRSMGNPIEKDTALHYFALVPDKPLKKAVWSLAAGMADAALDLCIPMAVSSVILSDSAAAVGRNLLSCLAWLIFILSLDYFSSCVGAFINLSVPVNAGSTIKQIVQIMFLYTGLVPDVIIMAVVWAVFGMLPAAIAATCINLILGVIFMLLLPLFI